MASKSDKNAAKVAEMLAGELDRRVTDGVMSRQQAEALVFEPQVRRLIPGRRFEADICCRGARMIFEVDGALWTKGRHSRPAGIKADHERDLAFLESGWATLRIDPGSADDAWATRAVNIAINRSVIEAFGNDAYVIQRTCN
jgi:very-short-patch-repair endonuclease